MERRKRPMRIRNAISAAIVGFAIISLATATTPNESVLFSVPAAFSAGPHHRNLGLGSGAASKKECSLGSLTMTTATAAAGSPHLPKTMAYRQHAVPPQNSVLYYRYGASGGDTEISTSQPRIRKDVKRRSPRRRKTRARVWLVRKIRAARKALDKQKRINGDTIPDDNFEDEYEKRKLEWAARYTDVVTLRSTFGTNRNQLWGDFDAETSRRLYHALLPRALLGLYDMGLMEPHELAPLAYEARIAAKQYARERCIWPGRVLAQAYDGLRTWKNYGRWSAEGMSWEQIWDKYEQQVSQEMCDWAEDDDEEITRLVCLRIMERSCRTNTVVDRLVLGGSRTKDVLQRRREIDVAAISAKFDRDIRDLLIEPCSSRATPRPRQP